jgi:hypothetical protein
VYFCGSWMAPLIYSLPEMRLCVPDASVGVTVGVEGRRTPAASGDAEQNYPRGDNLPAFPKKAPQAPRGMPGPRRTQPPRGPSAERRRFFKVGDARLV